MDINDALRILLEASNQALQFVKHYAASTPIGHVCGDSSGSCDSECQAAAWDCQLMDKLQVAIARAEKELEVEEYRWQSVKTRTNGIDVEKEMQNMVHEEKHMGKKKDDCESLSDYICSLDCSMPPNTGTSRIYAKSIDRAAENYCVYQYGENGGIGKKETVFVRKIIGTRFVGDTYSVCVKRTKNSGFIAKSVDKVIVANGSATPFLEPAVVDRKVLAGAMTELSKGIHFIQQAYEMLQRESFRVAEKDVSKSKK
jgi:hypothetical protein